METYLRLSGSDYIKAIDILYYLDSVFHFDKENKMDICHTILDVDKMFKSYLDKKNASQSKNKNLK